MRKLHLHTSEMLQGDFAPKKLNLLLVFQVNCPGCFIYALPLFNQLYEEYHDSLGFIALSTAFEDFNLNTKANTQLLISKRELVGETKKILKQQGILQLPHELHFPIGFDDFLEKEKTDQLVETICQLNPNFSIWSDFDRNLLREKVILYLKDQERTALTFTSNQFRGTPTFVLFNDKKDLLHSWFGHQSIQDIKAIIKEFS